MAKEGWVIAPSDMTGTLTVVDVLATPDETR